MPDVSFQSRAEGVTQPAGSSPAGNPGKVEPLSDMRRAEARSAEIGRPEGVSRAFQVSRYKVEPSEAVAARNLLAKDDSRAARVDQVEPCRP
jgi:hypothetical protein